MTIVFKYCNWIIKKNYHNYKNRNTNKPTSYFLIRNDEKGLWNSAIYFFPVPYLPLISTHLWPSSSSWFSSKQVWVFELFCWPPEPSWHYQVLFSWGLWGGHVHVTAFSLSSLSYLHMVFFTLSCHLTPNILLKSFVFKSTKSFRNGFIVTPRFMSVLRYGSYYLCISLLLYAISIYLISKPYHPACPLLDLPILVFHKTPTQESLYWVSLFLHI